MINFQYARAEDVADAIGRIAGDPNAKFVAAGTNLIDLMKMDVERPTKVIDITRLPLKQIEGENFKRPSLILMLPVFNADKTKVLISTDKPGDKSCDYVLEKAGNEWRMLSKNRNE